MNNHETDEIFLSQAKIECLIADSVNKDFMFICFNMSFLISLRLTSLILPWVPRQQGERRQQGTIIKKRT
jgi:hypothetical protein